VSYPSNPFAPPGQQPAPSPQDPQAWAPVQHREYAVPAPPAAPHQPLAPAPRGGNGLAITAIVLSGLALLSVLAMAAFLVIGSATGGGSSALTGEVTVVDKGASHSDLQAALVSAIEDDGGSVDEIVCPDRSQVGQGLVTVCHGSVDGFDWTGVVVFEDDKGTFIVTEY
jgi:hypothetical protein